LIDKKEKKQEKDRIAATTEVNSSMILASVLLARCNDVITKRQNPRRLAAVFRICCEVLFAMQLR
jgi:predicted solute-binding protein